MSLRRLIGAALFIAGVILLSFGIHSTGAFGEKVAKQFQGHYTNTTMWYLVGGSVLIVIGAGVAFSRTLRK